MAPKAIPIKRRRVHLKVDLWFSTFQSRQTGRIFLVRKRCSPEQDAHFPAVYRECYLEKGASGLAKQVMNDRKCSLAEAWDAVKEMFNTKPGWKD